MTPEKKNYVKLKGLTQTQPAKPTGTAITRTYCRQKGTTHYMTTKLLGQCHNQFERKGLFYIYPERLKVVARENN